MVWHNRMVRRSCLVLTWWLTELVADAVCTSGLSLVTMKQSIYVRLAMSTERHRLSNNYLSIVYILWCRLSHGCRPTNLTCFHFACIFCVSCSVLVCCCNRKQFFNVDLKSRATLWCVKVTTPIELPRTRHPKRWGGEKWGGCLPPSWPTRGSGERYELANGIWGTLRLKTHLMHSTGVGDDFASFFIKCVINKGLWLVLLAENMAKHGCFGCLSGC